MPTKEELEKRVAELEKLLALKEVKQSETLLQAILDNLPTAVIIKDTEGRHTMVNKYGLTLMDFTEEQVIGKTDADLFPPEFVAEMQKDELHVLETGESLQREITVQTPDGERHQILMRFPIYNDNKEIYAIGNVVTDITQFKEAEAEQQRLQQEVIAAQQRAIAELSTPVIPVMDRIIVMPMVGSIDSLRARDITRALLEGIGKHRAKIVILDVTGVSLMDTGIVNHLNKTIQAARLKGSQTIVTGISDAVAESIVDLGIDWSKITTLSDLQTGLIYALDSLGYKLNKT